MTGPVFRGKEAVSGGNKVQPVLAEPSWRLSLFSGASRQPRSVPDAVGSVNWARMSCGQAECRGGGRPWLRSGYRNCQSLAGLETGKALAAFESRRAGPWSFEDMSLAACKNLTVPRAADAYARPELDPEPGHLRGRRVLSEGGAV
jgi:hypothetical protein